jgi:hypothetical protein
MGSSDIVSLWPFLLLFEALKTTNGLVGLRTRELALEFWDSTLDDEAGIGVKQI